MEANKMKKKENKKWKTEVKENSITAYILAKKHIDVKMQFTRLIRIILCFYIVED